MPPTRVLDGYPRSLEQAEAVSRTLAACDTSIDVVLKFRVREDEPLTRLKRRASADDTEQTPPLHAYYHNELTPSPESARSTKSSHGCYQSYSDNH